MNNLRMIRVTGTGRLSLPPDRTIVYMELTDSNKDYAKVVEASTKHTGELKDALSELGFDRDKIKTIGFRVDVEKEGYQDEKHCWRERFVGYKAVHSAKVEFGVDNELLGRVMTVLAKLPFNPTFSITYTIRDLDKARKTLLTNAMKDAKEKAHVLAKAAGAKLGPVSRIVYGDEMPNFVADGMPRMARMDNMLAKGAAPLKVDINPDDITEEETVNVVYEMILD